MLRFWVDKRRDILAVHKDLPRRQRIKPRHHFDQRCLTRPGLPQQHVEMTRFQRQGRWLDMRDAAGGFAGVDKLNRHLV